jgi:2-dehydropantoate 2-reductase
VAAQPLKIGVVGAGGIGSYYAALASHGGHSVRLLARGAHLEAIRAGGLELQRPGETFVARVDATDDGTALRDSEFVIVSVKSYSLAEVAPTLVQAAAAGATIIPLLNGVDVAEQLEALGVPRQSIVGGLIAASIFRTDPGKVERRSPFDRMVIGELDRSMSERTKRFADAFNAVGVDARVSENIGLDLWRKFSFIVPMNVASGLTRGPVGEMLSTERGRALLSGVVAEIAAVSRVAGTPLDAAEEEKIRRDVLALPYPTTPSFLADLVRGGPTELDMLVGAVSRLGREHGVPTPIHDFAFTAFEAATAPKPH